MRNITLAAAVTLALSVVACATGRPANLDQNTTTTTSAQMPAATPAAAPPVQANEPVRTVTTATGVTTTTGPINPADETLAPDNRGDSFETSGGVSDPIVHRKVPGQDLWGTGPSPTVRDNRGRVP